MSRETERQAANKALGVLCQTDGCDKGEAKGGFCRYHYQQVVEARRAARGEVCSEPGCEAGLVAHGLCRRHYMMRYLRERRQQQRSGVVGQ